jgi:uncharacterized protein involved in type VI secretion and phage assembly
MDVPRVLADLTELIQHRHYGKYRGTVVDNQDPKNMGRLRLRVPNALGPDVVSGWATACIPYGGADQEGVLFIPAVGAGVWVEFEGGDREFPIWSGAYVSGPGGSTEAPKPNNADGSTTDIGSDPASRKTIKTAAGHTLQFEDASGSETVHLQDGVHGHRITLDGDGVTITEGSRGHRISIEPDAITLQYQGGDAITLDSTGIHIGGMTQHLVHGDAFKLNVASFLTSLMTHTHVGNLGAPTSPPVAPMTLEVPMSLKHTVG